MARPTAANVPQTPIRPYESGWIQIKSKIDVFFGRIEEGMQEDTFRIPAKEFIAIYDLIFELCVQRDPFNFSAKLYEAYCAEIYSYTETFVLKALKDSQKVSGDVNLFKEWYTRFSNHQLLTQGMSKMFGYLDKYYTNANIEKCQKLAVKSWSIYKSVIFDFFLVSIRNSVLARIKKEREMEPQDRLLLKNTIAVFIELGFKLHGPELGISLYSQNFETSFIAESHDYYRSLAINWMAQYSFPDYLIEVEKALQEEDSRILEYLHNSSRELIAKCIYTELLSTVREELLSKDTGPASLMSSNSTNDLIRMFNLFSKIPTGLEDISVVFCNYIKKIGVSIVEKKGASINVAEPKEGEDESGFVKQLIDLHERSRQMIVGCFQSNPLFQKSLKDAFESFFNTDASVSQLLAKYAGDILKKGCKLDHNEIEQIQINVVFLYGYIREKDIFEHEYQQLLAKRLLEGLSESEDTEKSMIAKLKNECGYQWTTKLEGMFKDVQNSKEICQDFLRKIENRFTIEFDISVCTQGHWPSVNITTTNIPHELTSLCSTFKDFYLNSHSGRRIIWRLDHGQADVKVKFAPNVSYQLTVTTYQMLVLLLFNKQEVFTYKEILELTGIPADVIEVQIKSLAHPKVKVLLKNPPTAVFDSDHTFKINDKYTSKMFKVKIPLMKMQAQAKQEETERDIEIENQRRHQIDAACVRIMKARKTLGNQQLVSEIVTQLSSRFQPKIPVIKQRIEHLIEQEYLERDSKDRTVYNYLA